MAENSKIEWCDHTFNPWVGCTKVSPACDHCYAEGWAKRTGQAHLWDGDRRRTSAANWRQPILWNRKAKAAGVRARVFCASLADVFDNQVPAEWRRDLFDLIAETQHLDWLLLTKRPQNIARMIDDAARQREHLNPNYLWPWPNVWFGTTAENQEEADRRIPHLLSVPATKRFLSCEPLLGPVNIARWLPGSYECGAECGFRSATAPPAERCNHCEWEGEGAGEFCPECGGQDWTHVCPDCCSNVNTGHPDTPHINWVIVGGESGLNARPMHPDWPRSLLDQCQKARVPFFFKQWGEWAPYQDHCAWYQTARHSLPMLNWNGKAWTNEDLTDMPPDVLRVGKKRAGAMLDGREWREMPGEAAR